MISRNSRYITNCFFNEDLDAICEDQVNIAFHVCFDKLFHRCKKGRVKGNAVEISSYF